MPRPKGLPKTGGRKVGVPNKASIPVAELCAFHKCSPIEVLIKLALDTNPNDKGYQFQAAKELANYLYPKRTATTVTLEQYTPEELLTAAEQMLKEVEAQNDEPVSET